MVTEAKQGWWGREGLPRRKAVVQQSWGKGGGRNWFSQAWVPGTEGKQVLEQLTCVGHGEPSGLGAV